eukprot:CAMPEP_0172901324 /NCGR_PEP_ID=MMETSP1075-20121228/166041_1 /TAXON_ID=2916 /ORGANISM="Ceratium fusus, Strain PA161109" /LENGTH=112 /DNA_ID=CAMNT_0013757695 /DNA_START=1 /DNA_END=336 /DNA_ORIENTATION=+
MLSKGAVVATGHDLQLPSAFHAGANRIAVKVTDARDGWPVHRSLDVMAITLPVAVALLSSKKNKALSRRRVASCVFDPKRPYEVYPEQSVIGEKDACGAGMMANMTKPPNHL